MQNLWNFIKNLFSTEENDLVGLKHLNRVKVVEDTPKSVVKKEYKLSELMKKSAIE